MNDRRDEEIASRQIGRTPRTPWRTSVRCTHGRPQVLASPPLLDDGTPFPTLYWLTCPFVARAVREAESSGMIARFAGELASDTRLAAAMLAADAELRRRRAEEGGGSDPCPGVGLAGQRDPLATKCLHAHAASALADIGDPLGERLLAACGRECANDECAALAAQEDPPR